MQKWKIDNMDQLMNIEKVAEFNFLNEEVKEFTRRCSQSLFNVRSSSYLKYRCFTFRLINAMCF